MKATPYLCIQPQLVELCPSPLDFNKTYQEAKVFRLRSLLTNTENKAGPVTLEIDNTVN